MSIQSEISRISGAKSDIKTAIANKGVTVPAGTKLDGLAALIDDIETGGGLPSFMTACAETEWIATGIANNQYCAIPHGLGVRPDYIRMFIDEEVTGSRYDRLVWELWKTGWVDSSSGSASFGSYLRFSNSSQSWIFGPNSVSSSTHHVYADSTDFYVYHSTLSSYIVNGRKYKVIAYRLNLPDIWRGPYEYTTDPTV